MKKYILIIFLALLSLFIVATNGNFSDFREKGPSGYVFIFEGGKQNAIMRNNELVIDSGAVDFKYNKNYVVFSVDTTYSIKPQEINKSQLKYYLFEVKTNVLKENIKFDEFKMLVKEKSLDDINITK